MRIRARLALSFLSVIAALSAAALLMVGPAAESAFRSFVFSGDAEKARVYGALLADFYDEKGNWEGAQAFVAGMPARLLASIEESVHARRAAPEASTAALADAAAYAGAAKAPTAGQRLSAGAEAAAAAESAYALLSDRVALADPDGVVVVDTAGRLLGSVHPPAHLAHGLPVLSGGRRVGTVLVGSMIESSLTAPGERFLRRVFSAVLSATLLSAALALLLGLGLSARMTRPLAALARAARRVQAGDLSARVDARGGDEVAELSGSFNAMAAELARLEEAKRRIIADAAHELRTPAALIQGAVEAMLDGVFPRDDETLRSVHEEALRLARLIESLRELESAESGELELRIEELDALEEARGAAALFEAPARAKGLSLCVSGEGAARVLADAFRLREILSNFLANAVRHAPEGGRVRLLARERQAPDPPARRDRDGGWRTAAPFVEFAVEDSGPGVPPAERERVFERFYRLDASRSSGTGGRGLGLSIASGLAKAMGGRIELGESELGGAAFLLLLPAAGNGVPPPGP